MPEGRNQEHNNCFFSSSALTLSHETVIYVEFEPEMDLVVPALEHSHARGRSLNSHDVDTYDLIPLIECVRFLSLFVSSSSSPVVGEATGNHRSIRQHERSVIKEFLTGHSDVVEDNSLPERHGSVGFSPASRHCEMSAHTNEDS